MTTDDARDRLIAELREQVSALEAIVRRRSDELRLIQCSACAKDRALISTILDGDGAPDLAIAAIEAYYSMDWFDDSTQFHPASVEGELDNVWSSPTGRAPESEASE